VDGDLAVLGAARRAGVLTLHPHRRGALLDVPGLIDHQHPVIGSQMLDHVLPQIPATPSWSHEARASRCCIPSGLASPTCSAIDQQFTLDSPANKPSRKRGHADAARPEETCPRSDLSTHPGPAATGRGLRCGTRPPQDHLLSSQTRIIKRWPSRTPDRHANSMITIYGWSTRPPGSHLGGPGLRRRHGELVALDDVREPFGLREWDLVAVRELDELRHFCFAALGQVDDRPEELFESGR
jgi:hypothetical protein